MNTIGGDVLVAINKAIDLSEKNIKVCYQAANFSVGNIGMIL
jgi:3-hydroxyacyl-CoA dehydrogenase